MAEAQAAGLPVVTSKPGGPGGAGPRRRGRLPHPWQARAVAGVRRRLCGGDRPIAARHPSDSRAEFENKGPPHVV